MMKGKTNLIWRIAIALVLTVSMGLATAVPVAANGAGVTGITMVSPTTASPVYVKAGGSFVGNFTTVGGGTGNGTVQLAIVQGATSLSVLNATNVTNISNVAQTAIVPAGAAEGFYNLTVQAKNETQTDYFNKTETGAVKIDNTLPTFNIAVQDWDIANSAAYNITWTKAETNANSTALIIIDLYRNATFIGNINNTAQSATSFAWWSPKTLLHTWNIPSVLGTDYKFKLTTTDLAGNTGSNFSPLFSIYAVDNNLPSVSIVTPPVLDSPYFVHIRGNYILNATATDTESLIANVQFAYSTNNGTSWTNVGSAVTTPSPAPYYSTPFNTTAISDGPIYVRATAKNTVGATNSATNPRVVVDNTKPTVTMTLPANGTFVPLPFTMTGTATDAYGFNETGVKFQYQVTPGPDWSDLYTFSVPSNSTTHTYTADDVWPGESDNTTIHLRVFAQDKAGNWANSSISNVIIDDTPPANLTVITPNGGEVWNINATYNITWTVPTDAHHPIGPTPVWIGLYKGGRENFITRVAPVLLPANGTAGNATTGVYPWTVPAVVPDTNYIVCVVATDLAGNQIWDISNDTFTIWGVDSTAPSSVILTAPANGAIVRRTIPVSATAVDNESGIQMVVFKYSIDNGTTWHEINEELRSPPWTTNWNTFCDVGTASNVKVEAIAKNGVGLKTTSNIVTITVDNRRPEVDIVTIPEYISALPVIKGSANDTNSGIASVKLFIEQYHEYYDSANGTWPEIYSAWNGTTWVLIPEWSDSTAGSASVRPAAESRSFDSFSDDGEGGDCGAPTGLLVNATYSASTHKWSYNSTAIPLTSEDYENDDYWEYWFYAIATDNAGNIKFAFNDNGNYGWFYYRYYDYLTLYPAWNFISIPSRPSPGSDTFGELFAGYDVAEAWAYNPNVSGGWVEITPTTPVEVLSAYWVYLNSGKEEYVKFSYDTYAKSVPPAKVLKGDAWNAIGPSGPWVYYYESYSYTVYEELKSIEGSWSNMVDWDAEYQQYEYIIIAPGYKEYQYSYPYHYSDDSLYCGKGYWLFVSNPSGDTLSSSINGNCGE